MIFKWIEWCVVCVCVCNEVYWKCVSVWANMTRDMVLNGWFFMFYDMKKWIYAGGFHETFFFFLKMIFDVKMKHAYLENV